MAVAIFPLTFVTAAEECSEPTVSAVNFLRIDHEVCSAGQPSLRDLENLKQQGLRAVVNLRRLEEDPVGQASEKEQVERLGLKYFAIPVDTRNIQPSQIEEFRRIVRDKSNVPLFIHCRTAARVGAFWFIHRVLDDGWECWKAEEEARRIGLRTQELTAFAKSYVQARRPQLCLR